MSEQPTAPEGQFQVFLIEGEEFSPGEAFDDLGTAKRKAETLNGGRSMEGAYYHVYDDKGKNCTIPEHRF